MFKKLKLIGIALLIVSLMTCILVMPSVCIDGATFGLLLWFNKLLPSLLPFIILTQMLCSLGIISQVSTYISAFTQKLFGVDGTSFVVFAIGLIAGYPTGVKMTRQLLDQNQLSKEMAQKCLCFVNNCGALFIIGTVGSIILGNVTLGYFLVLTHILSAFTMLLLSRFYKVPTYKQHTSYNHQTSPSFIAVFNQSVQGGMDTIVYVGGYIIFFSMLSNILKHLDSFQTFLTALSDFLHLPVYFLNSIVYGMIEFSSGIALTVKVLPLTPSTLALIAFILTFGGFCVFFQSSYVLQGSGLKLTYYLACKLFQGIVAATYTLLLCPLLPTGILPERTQALPHLLLVLLCLIICTSILYRTSSTAMIAILDTKRKR
ncbi:MAG: hypothetical protein ACRCW2_14095 [Cellulosilyticaceae bacterium]